MKFIVAAILAPLALSAAILPDTIGPFHRVSTGQAVVTDRAVWEEYVLKGSESGAYENGKAKLTATVWQLQDTTGGLAAFDWVRSANSTPSALGPHAAETKDSLVILQGNYLISLEGYKPTKEELDPVLANLKNVDAAPLPPLASHLPDQGLVPNSERYVTGPAGLQKFAPVIPPSIAAFSSGAEAQLGVFRNPKGDMTLAIFNYPTHQIAMQREGEFQKIPGAVVKRSGPLLAVTVNPPDSDFAERVLGQIRYQAEVTRDEYVPTKRDNIGVLVINIFELIGILLIFGLVSGLIYGGMRAFRRRGGRGEEAEALTTLHIGSR